MSSDIVVYDPNQAIERVKNHNDIVVRMRSEKILRQGTDYGKIPGTGNKPTLLKPGAERLCSAFGLSPQFEMMESTERWDTENPLFHYRIKCKLVHIETGLTIATGVGSCNSMESKYRWRWVWSRDLPEGIDKTTLLTRKRNNGTQYRIPNDDIYSQVNTIDKMAQKRALIAAVLIGCNASEHFTQDVEDLRQFVEDDIEEAKFEIIPEWINHKNIDVLIASWGTKGIAESEVLIFAGVKDKYDLASWKEYKTGKDVNVKINAAIEAEIKNTPPDTAKEAKDELPLGMVDDDPDNDPGRHLDM
jgi:hypothetical protein